VALGVGGQRQRIRGRLHPDYKILHDAGYHVLAYDLRNHGLSGAANGGITTSGIFEARDVVGSLSYARSRPETREAAIGLFSRCMGASSTFSAMTQFPAAFDGVRCLVAPQPVTAATIVERRLAVMGLSERIGDLEQRILVRTGIGFAPRNPREWARNVRIPTFLYQVRDDVLTHPSDVQTMFDNIPPPRRSFSGSTARPPAGMATWNSSAAPAHARLVLQVHVLKEPAPPPVGLSQLARCRKAACNWRPGRGCRAITALSATGCLAEPDQPGSLHRDRVQREARNQASSRESSPGRPSSANIDIWH
jgi:hypothetical protein